MTPISPRPRASGRTAGRPGSRRDSDRGRATIGALLLTLGALLSGPQPAGPGPGAAQATVAAAAGDTARFPLIAILNYHDLSNEPGGRLDTVSHDLLRAQIRSFKATGWTFLSLSELLAARDHPARLPPRVVVLTFDDGYRSFSDLALPILREERVKATVAVITSIAELDLPPYMNWQHIQEAERSGWVEIASHTHNLHRYVTSNPWRDTAPAVTVRRYQLKEARYEDRDAYRNRIAEDLAESQRLMREKLGHDVTVLAWPFGAYNLAARRLAAEAGFPVTLTLDSREVRPEDLRAGCLPRVYVTREMAIRGDNLAWLRATRGPLRAALVDLDAVYDPNPEEFRRRVDRVVERVRAIGATDVVLPACPDPDGEGRPREAWFMNHQVPLRADVWSMVAHKLIHANMKIWIRAPSMSLAWLWERADWRIASRRRAGAAPPRERLSPDLTEVRRAAIDFYTDLAVYLPIDGVLFGDDAYMLPGERLVGGGGSLPEAKAAAIHALHQELMAAVRAWRPECRFAREVEAATVTRAGAHPAWAQDFARCLVDYDLTVVTPAPRPEGRGQGGESPAATLARAALRRWLATGVRSPGPPPVMLRLEARDRIGRQWVSGHALQRMAWEARRAGVAHLAVSPVLPEGGDLAERLLEGLAPPGLAARDSLTAAPAMR